MKLLVLSIGRLLLLLKTEWNQNFLGTLSSCSSDVLKQKEDGYSEPQKEKTNLGLLSSSQEGIKNTGIWTGAEKNNTA